LVVEHLLESPAAPVAEPRRLYDGDSALGLYLRDVGQVPLLTAAEEVTLGKRVQAGDLDAREHMIRANLRLVIKIARDYEHFGVPVLDLINEGNIGLMRAVERFDPRRGVRFSTYSAWWIKQSIRRGLANQSKTIRLPVHVIDKLSKSRKVALALRKDLGREASLEEMADEMGIKVRRLAELQAAAQSPTSLDAPLANDESSRFGDLVADGHSRTPYEELADRTILELLGELVSKLNPRHAGILRSRFGLDGAPESTLDEIGSRMGVTRERIRQLQNEALVRLRRMIEEREGMAAAA